MSDKESNQYRSDIGRTAEMSFTLDIPQKTDIGLYLLDMLTTVIPVFLIAFEAGSNWKGTVVATLSAFVAHGRGFLRDSRGKHKQTRRGDVKR